jgi:hypothetical protein
MGDDINTYKRSVQQVVSKWRGDIGKLKLNREFSNIMDDLEEAKENKKPSADDKKKTINLQLAARKAAEKIEDPASKRLELDLKRIPIPNGADPKKLSKMVEDIINSAGDGIPLSDNFSLSVDLSYDSQEKKLDSASISAQWKF